MQDFHFGFSGGGEYTPDRLLLNLSCAAFIPAAQSGRGLACWILPRGGMATDK